MKFSKGFIGFILVVCISTGCRGAGGLSSSEKAKLARIEAIKNEMDYTLESPEQYVEAVTILLTGADTLDEMEANLGDRKKLISSDLIGLYSVSRAPDGVEDSGDPVMEGDELEEYKKWLEEYLNSGQEVVDGETESIEEESNSEIDESSSDMLVLPDKEDEEHSIEESEDGHVDSETESEVETEAESEPEGTLEIEARNIGYIAMAQSGGDEYVYSPDEVITYDFDTEGEQSISDDDYLNQLLDLDITITEYQIYYRMIIMTRLTNSGPVYYKVDLDDSGVIINITSFR